MKAAALALSVLTLNVAGPRRVHQGWQSRREALIAAVKSESPDIAAFQEAWREEDAAALADAAGHPHRAHEPALGLSLSSRLPVVDRAALDLGGGGGVLRAGFAVDGSTADVYCVRLSPAEDAPGRLGRLLAAAEFIREQSRARPLAILGDLAASSDDKEAEIFLDLLGARDLCVSYGDEMCGRTFEDRRVDFALIPYASRPPRRSARTAFTATIGEAEEARPLSTHYGLAATLDGAWLKLRLAGDPEGRVEALAAASDRLDAARAAAEARAAFAGWLPWAGAWLSLRARQDVARFSADGERARTALARAAKGAPPPAYD